MNIAPLMESLEDYVVPEWRDAYFKLDRLLPVIKQLETANRERISDPQQTDQFATEFINLATSELQVVSAFYLAIYERQQEKIEEIISQSERQNLSEKAKNDVHSNLISAYAAITQLVKFADTNASWFFKAVRRFDQLFNEPRVGIALQKEFMAYSIADTKPLRELCNVLEDACARFLHIPIDKAKQHMSSLQRQGLVEAKRQRAMLLSGIFMTVAVFMFLCLLEVMLQKVKYSANQQCFIRLQISICFVVISLGYAIRAFEKRQINYQLIWDLPAHKLTATYRTVLAAGSAAMALVLFCVVLSTAEVYDHDQLDFPFGRLLGDFVDKINANIILVIPMVAFAAISTGSAVRYAKKGRSRIWRYVMIVTYKVFTPWRHKVTFILFYSADVLTSCGAIIKDVLGVVGFQRCPDYIIFVIVNIPAAIRAIQCYKRYAEKSPHVFYPHGWNFLKYMSGVLASFNNFNAIKNNMVTFWIFTVAQFSEQIYKYYWDLIEDWSLFTGGTGAKQFRKLPNKWTHPTICRRPTSCTIPFILWCVIYDFIVRFQFILALTDFYLNPNMWWRGLLILLEISRRFLWSILRLDNQQATNCENYEVANYFDVDENDAPKKTVYPKYT